MALAPGAPRVERADNGAELVAAPPARAFRIAHRAVHYACELEATAAAAAEADGEILVEGGDDEAPMRDKLAHLMKKAIDLVDVLDDLM